MPITKKQIQQQILETINKTARPIIEDQLSSKIAEIVSDLLSSKESIGAIEELVTEVIENLNNK
jgi:hypothetical protein